MHPLQQLAIDLADQAAADHPLLRYLMEPKPQAWWRRANIEPFVDVRDLLNRLSENSVRDYDESLRDAWLAVHPEARRQWSR